jgi:hypothetical protein
VSKFVDQKKMLLEQAPHSEDSKDFQFMKNRLLSSEIDLGGLS